MAKMDAAARNALDDSDFAYVDSKGERHLPINDEGHIRAAMARFNQTQFESAEAKSKAHAKIVAAAKKFGIDVQSFTEVPFTVPLDADFSMTEDGAFIFDDPTSSAVYVPAVVGNPKAFGKNLVQRIKKHFQGKSYMTADDANAHIRAAAGHAGGTARPKKAADGAGSDTICPSCQAAGHGATPDCTCEACQEGDPEDCICQDLFDDQAEQKGMGERTPSPLVNKAGEGFRLFIPVSLSEIPQWIHYRPKPGTFQSPKYGEITIALDDNREMVQNFNSGAYQSQVPVDAEHNTKLSGAMAWIKELRLAPDNSIEARLEWTKRGRNLITIPKAASEPKQADEPEFKFFSPEWYDVWTSPDGETFRNVAIGGAITTRPFFKENHLRPLLANEQGIEIYDESGNPAVPPAQPKTNRQEHSMGDTPDVPTVEGLNKALTEQQQRATEAGKLAAEAKTASETGKPEEKRIALAEMAAHEARKDLADLKVTALSDQIKTLAEKAEAEAKAKADAEAEKAKGMTEEAKKLTELESENKQMAERVQALEADKAFMGFMETARTFAEGDDAIREAAEYLRDGFASDAARNKYVQERKAFAEQVRTSALFGNAGVRGDSNQQTGRDKIKSLTEQGMSYQEAYKKVASEEPDSLRDSRA